MLTVSRYLLREFSLASATVLMGLVLTWVAADTLLHVDEVGDDIGAALADVVYRLLDVLPLGVPMACAVGVVWSITRAVRSREITAIRCGGIPLRSALAPILVLAALIGFGLGLFEDRVIMKARQIQLEVDAGEERSRPRPEKKNGHYWYASGRSIFVAQDYDADARTLKTVTAFEYGPSRDLIKRIDAERAIFVAERTWEFQDARVREFGDGALTETRSAAIQVDLGLSGADMERADVPIEAETLHELAQRIEQERSEDVLLALETRFHSRLAQPIAVLVLVLLAIPFAIGDVERGDSLPRALLAAMLAAGGFWVAWSLALVTARNGIAPPALPLWSAMGLFLGAGLWMFSRVRE